MFKARVLVSSAVTVALALLILGSASLRISAQTDTTPTPSGTIDPTTTALLRLVHASPDAPNIDLYVDKADSPLISDLPFDSATDGYVTIPAGSHQLTITASGDKQTVEYDDSATLAAGTATTVIMEGLVADKSFSLRYTLDDLSPTNGKARIKITHAISDGPKIDLVTSDFKQRLISKLDYGFSSTVDVDPGNYDAFIVPTGKQSPILIDLTGTVLKADQIYTIFATGTLNGKVPMKPLLFVTSPVPGFTIPIATGTMAPTAVQ